MPPSKAQADPLALIQRALRRCALFRDWPDLVLDRIARIARLEHYERRTQVMAQDRLRREVLVVVSGYLEVSGVSAGGAKFMLSLIGPGEVVGLVRLLKVGARLYDYHAHEDTVLVHLPSEALHAVLDQTPLLWKDVALLALERQRDSIIAMQRRALGGLQQSVAETLLKLVGGQGRREEGSKAVRLRVSQSDLAHMVSVSRQTMNKELRLLAQQGIVAADYGQLTILDLPALRRIAEGQG